MRRIAHLVAFCIAFHAGAVSAEEPLRAGASGSPAHASAGEGGVQAPAGLATPDGESWGDEWFDERARERAAAFEQRLIREAAGAQAPVALHEDAGRGEGDRRAAPVEAAVRSIAPPRHGLDDVARAWRDRREGLLRQDDDRARQAEALVRELLYELDVREVHAFAAAAVRESRKLEGSAPGEALDRARFAAFLAPSLPLTHLQLLRAQIAHDPLALGKLATFAGDALVASVRDPRSVRLLAFDLAAALGLAFLLAGALALLVLGSSHLRPFLHDFHHLFPRSISRLQTGLLAAILLAIPLALGLGPLSAAALLLAGLWRHLERTEQVALGLWLCLASMLPAAAGYLAPRIDWDDTPAAALYAVERAGDFTALRQLADDVRGSDADPAALFALARARKRLGELDQAGELYQRALDHRPRWPEALVNLGNVRLLQGDLDGAERLYTRAIDADPGLAEAYFDLSRVHYDRVDLALGQAARARAVELEPALVDRYAVGAEGSPPANQYVVDMVLPDRELAAAALRGNEGEAIERQLTRWLLGPVPPAAAPLAGGLFVLLLAGACSSLRPGRKPAYGCSRCGRPVCGACDPETAGGNLCGQCLNVFGRRAAVEPAVRELKERSVRAHQARRTLRRRVACLLLAGPFLSGSVARGFTFLVLGWAFILLLVVPGGLVQPVYDGWPVAWRSALLVPPLALLYGFAWRDLRGGR